MPVLGLPLLLVGLAALPVAAGIYWLRTRYRSQPVSALFLWQSATQAQGGGRKKHRLQTPLALLIELLVLALLVLAATAPRVLRPDIRAAVTVILDDSYSMLARNDQAGGDPASAGTTPRDRAIRVLRQELNSLGRFRVRLIKAGPEPELIEGSATTWRQLEAMLAEWQPEAWASDLAAAMLLAVESGSPQARVLVLSDRPPPTEPADAESGPQEPMADDSPEAPDSDTDAQPQIVRTAAAASPSDIEWLSAGRVRWHSVGRPVANVGIINAARSTSAASSPAEVEGTGADADRLLLEIANFSPSPQTRRLSLYSRKLAVVSADAADPSPGSLVDQQTMQLDPGEVRRLWLTPRSLSHEVLIAQLDADALPADDAVTLLPSLSPPLPVSLDVGDEALDRNLRRALLASGRAVLVEVDSGGGETSVLHFTDRLPLPVATTEGTISPQNTSHQSNGPRWVVRFITKATTATTADGGDVADQSSAETEAFLGPFVINTRHPMAEGVSLTGLVWSVPTTESKAPTADADSAPAGEPLITVGRQVLLSDRRRPDGGHELTWRMATGGSTVLGSAAFPVMAWNLVNWRADARPGVRPVNARPGNPVRIAVSPQASEVLIHGLGSETSSKSDTPRGDAVRVAVTDGAGTYWPTGAGLYRVEGGTQAQAFAVQRASVQGSDLRPMTTAEYGDWDRPETVAREYRGLAWAAGLSALSLLLLHAWWVYGRAESAGVGRGKAAMAGETRGLEIMGGGA